MAHCHRTAGPVLETVTGVGGAFTSSPSMEGAKTRACYLLHVVFCICLLPIVFYLCLSFSFFRLLGVFTTILGGGLAHQAFKGRVLENWKFHCPSARVYEDESKLEEYSLLYLLLTITGDNTDYGLCSF